MHVSMVPLVAYAEHMCEMRNKRSGELGVRVIFKYLAKRSDRGWDGVSLGVKAGTAPFGVLPSTVGSDVDVWAALAL